MDIPKRLNGLDLFSGIGGNTLALRRFVKTIAYCEFERHAQGVLLSRMRSGDIEPAPIWDDVSTLTAEQFADPIDIIVGGFPCQDISTAGKGAGIKEGTRSGLFYQVIRLVNELRPTFVFLENVPAIRTRGLDLVLKELTEAGYDCRWTMLAASSVGAPHKRERWFLLAYSSIEPQRKQDNKTSSEPRKDSREGFSGRGERGADEVGSSYWQTEPNVDRVANGVPYAMDRLSRLGNSVVPAQAEEAFKILIGIK